MGPSTRRFLTDLLRTARWHRRALAAVLAAAAVALAVQAARPAPPATVEVTVAARDIPGGAALQEADLTTVAIAPDRVPPTAVPVDEGVGSVVVGPVGAGEVLTSSRLLGTTLLTGWGPDLVAAPVRIADASAAALLSPGDHIDLLGADGSGHADTLGADVPVLTVPHAADRSSLDDSALLVVAVTPEQAARLADAAVAKRVSFILRPTPDVSTLLP